MFSCFECEGPEGHVNRDSRINYRWAKSSRLDSFSLSTNIY